MSPSCSWAIVGDADPEHAVVTFADPLVLSGVLEVFGCHARLLLDCRRMVIRRSAESTQPVRPCAMTRLRRCWTRRPASGPPARLDLLLQGHRGSPGPGSSVSADPIASMTYGGRSSTPSAEITPSASVVNEVDATTRTESLISIASAPASRSSPIALIRSRLRRLRPPGRRS